MSVAGQANSLKLDIFFAFGENISVETIRVAVIGQLGAACLRKKRCLSCV